MYAKHKCTKHIFLLPVPLPQQLHIQYIMILHIGNNIGSPIRVGKLSAA